jgi:hypothetical protein
MKKPQGRPPKSVEDSKTQYLQVRVTSSEKEGFDQAANLAGVPLSTWVRERLRAIARQELKEFGEVVPFIHKKKDKQ